jgi:hypothetical protein
MNRHSDPFPPYPVQNVAAVVPHHEITVAFDNESAERHVGPDCEDCSIKIVIDTFCL